MLSTSLFEVQLVAESAIGVTVLLWQTGVSEVASALAWLDETVAASWGMHVHASSLKSVQHFRFFWLKTACLGVFILCLYGPLFPQGAAYSMCTKGLASINSISCISIYHWGPTSVVCACMRIILYKIWMTASYNQFSQQMKDSARKPCLYSSLIEEFVVFACPRQ